MSEKYIEIRFSIHSREQSDLVIACINDIMEPEGFEEGEDFVKAYVSEELYDQSVVQDFADAHNIVYSVSFLANKNWNAIWESEFQPVIIDDFVAIRAEFHKPIDTVTHDIIITPKMSFGTGHHATTVMMIRALQQYGCSGKTVADFGTGTGVLAILAEKMGAREVLAIDYDEWSIDNARDNIAGNHCINIQILKKDCFPDSGSWDIVLANVNLKVITENLLSFYRRLNDNGLLIVSGILEKDKEELITSALSLQLVSDGIKKEKDWICLAFKKRRPF